MIKKNVTIVLFVFSLIILTSGCETTKGIAQGVGYTVKGTAEGTSKDAKNFWQAVLKADNWFRENLW